MSTYVTEFERINMCLQNISDLLPKHEIGKICKIIINLVFLATFITLIFLTSHEKFEEDYSVN